MDAWIFTMKFVAFLRWFATFTSSEKVAVIAAFLVLVGVVGEYVIELPAIEEKPRIRRRIKRLSMALLLLGLTGDVLGIVMGQAEMEELTQETGHAATLATTAHDEAKAAMSDSSTALSQSTEAETKSGDALDKAGKAQRSLGGAENEAKAAQTASLNALKMSNEANNSAASAKQEAESFEKDIKSAKEQATEAESHLADALREASAAQRELNLLKTPRSLTDVPAFIAAIKPFAGTEFSFLGVFGEQESIHLAAQISKALIDAGWKPVLPPYAFALGPQHFKLENFPYEVQESLVTGINVVVETEETPEILNALPMPQRPTQIRAGFELKKALGASLDPPQNDLTTAPLNIFEDQKYRGPQFKTVLVDVGKKPQT